MSAARKRDQTKFQNRTASRAQHSRAAGQDQGRRSFPDRTHRLTCRVTCGSAVSSLFSAEDGMLGSC